MAKLHVSVSRMISRRAAAMSRARSSSDNDGRRWSFESGDESIGMDIVGTKERPDKGSIVEDRLAMGSIQVVKKDVTDLLR